jgi:hypothetical protein
MAWRTTLGIISLDDSIGWSLTPVMIQARVAFASKNYSAEFRT